MSAHAIPAKAHADPGPHGPGPHDADTQAHRHVLNDLIAMGADLARFLHGQAAAHVAQQAAAPLAQQAQPVTNAQPAPASEALISLTLAFDRIARSVRRGILLARSLARPVQPAPDPAQVSAQARAAARRQVIRAVEDAIQQSDSSASDSPDGSETLHAELHERLDGPDLDDDISTRPAADIIAEICRDLGIAAPSGGTRPWKRRMPGDIRQLCAEAAAPSGACQPGAAQPGTGPQAPRRGVAQPTPGPQPGRPAAISPAQPGPIHPGPLHPGSTPPGDAAGTLVTILRHPPRVHGRWRPPPQV